MAQKVSGGSQRKSKMKHPSELGVASNNDLAVWNKQYETCAEKMALTSESQK